MTDIYFSYDTEDYTSDYASDAIREIAHILRENGIRANFNVVGYLARELVRHDRRDVLEELKYHAISLHSLRHSFHPTICEYTDTEDFFEGLTEFYRQEYEAMGMVKAATGVDELLACGLPGNSFSYVALYGYASMGLPLHFGSSYRLYDGTGGMTYFCNTYNADYYRPAMEDLFLSGPEPDLDSLADMLAKQKRVVLYDHPNRVLYSEWWDMVNYRGENKHPYGQWEEAPRREQADVDRYYRVLRSLLRRLKNDPRFRFPAPEDLLKEADRFYHGRVLRREDVPAVINALKKNFTWVVSPVPLSIADCFFAFRHFLISDDPYVPGNVHGFLETPEGITEPVTVTREEVEKAVRDLSPENFLPPYFLVGSKKIGPADLLFAMAEILEGKDRVTLTPREQNCSLERLKWLNEERIGQTWIHSPNLEDRYLTKRLRLQAWTIITE